MNSALFSQQALKIKEGHFLLYDLPLNFGMKVIGKWWKIVKNFIFLWCQLLWTHPERFVWKPWKMRQWKKLDNHENDNESCKNRQATSKVVWLYYQNRSTCQSSLIQPSDNWGGCQFKPFNCDSGENDST